MNIKTILDRVCLGPNKIHKASVVIPLNVWQEIEDKLEDLAASQSSALKTKITKARKEKGLYSALEVKKILKL